MFKFNIISQLVCSLFLFSALQAAENPSNGISQEEVLTRLKEGNKRFVDNKLTYCTKVAEAKNQAREAHLPIASILSCSDARVGPEMVFDQGLGDLFVVRVAGNVVSDFGIGSLEYAAQYLGAPVIVVLGHTRCGAMEAFLQTFQKGSFLEGHIENLVLAAYPASKQLKNIGTATLNEMIVANVQAAKKQLVDSSPVLSRKVEEGRLKVVGAVYDIDTGVVTFLDDHRQSDSPK